MSYHLSTEDSSGDIATKEEFNTVQRTTTPIDDVNCRTVGAELKGMNHEESKDVGGSSLCSRIITKNSFVIKIILAVLLAYAYPPFGAVHLRPQITSAWIALVLMFFICGVKLKSEAFKNALESTRFNVTVQAFNFLVVSGIAFGVSRALCKLGMIDETIADGMVICACLPCTMNSVVVLSQSSGGDEAAAVFNSTVSNMLGIAVTPALILMYIGVEGKLDVQRILLKLVLRVVVPTLVGQLLRAATRTVVDFVTAHGKILGTIQEFCVVFIVYTVFCKTFLSELGATTRGIVLMVAIQFILISSLMLLAWLALMCGFPNDPKLRVTGLFVCTHKSVGMGIPLINAIFEHNNNIGLKVLPLLVWHPMQILIGTFLAPHLSNIVDSEERRLACKRGAGLVKEDCNSEGYSPRAVASQLV